MPWTRPVCKITTLVGCLSVSATVLAAEGFTVRHSLGGAFGNDVFANPAAPSLLAGLAYTDVHIRQVTGGDGQPLTKAIAGGVLPLPAPAPAALYPRYAGQTAQLNVTGSARIWHLTLGYLSPWKVGNGNLTWGLVVPYATRQVGVQLAAATPTLAWPHAQQPNAATRAAVARQLGSAYPSRLAAMGASESGEVGGLGDIEVSAGWRYADERWRVLAGAALIAPTAQRTAGQGVFLSAGNYYTLRPNLQVGYLITPTIGLTGRLGMGMNTTNHDTRVRSGNWASAEAGAAWKTGVGGFGLNLGHVQQIQDDSNSPWGSNRYRSTLAGVSYNVNVPVIDAALTLQYAGTLQARNALETRQFQVRLLRQF